MAFSSRKETYDPNTPSSRTSMNALNRRSSRGTTIESYRGSIPNSSVHTTSAAATRKAYLTVQDRVPFTPSLTIQNPAVTVIILLSPITNLSAISGNRPLLSEINLCPLRLPGHLKHPSHDPRNLSRTGNPKNLSHDPTRNLSRTGNPKNLSHDPTMNLSPYPKNLFHDLKNLFHDPKQQGPIRSRSPPTPAPTRMP